MYSVFMHVYGGRRSFAAGPECHLAAVYAIEDVALNAWSGLLSNCNLVNARFMNSGNSPIASIVASLASDDDWIQEY